MKRFLFVITFVIIAVWCNISNLYAQTEWKTLLSDCDITSSFYDRWPLNIEKTSDGFILANRNPKNNKLSFAYGKIYIGLTSRDDMKIVKFDIDRIKGKELVYDIIIRIINPNLEIEELRFVYSVVASSADTSFCKTKILKSKFSNNEWRQTYESEWKEEQVDMPMNVLIQYYQGTIKIGASTYPQVHKIESIYIGLAGSTSLKISNFMIQEQTLYGRVKSFIDNGDQYLKQEYYREAVLEYTKAIDAEYKNYDIYMKRARALIGSELYVSAIEDLSNAISYNPTTDAYLIRGKIKAMRQDPSCIDDFRKGGVEGEMILKELGVDSNTSTMPQNTSRYTSSGSGVVLSSNGIIATNYHVIEGAQQIDVFINRNNEVKKYKAIELISDKQNDLSLLKIEDSSFTTLPRLPYAVKTSIEDVGTSVFALGYPMSDVLGEEIKVTDGIISSKTGFQGDIVAYQISAPIQPGNSGGPLFDNYGYLVGITNAGIPDAQNVGYAIKISYLRPLVEASPIRFSLPVNNTIGNLSFTEKIKRISPYVVLIKVQ